MHCPFKDSMKKILQAANVAAAEEAVKAIKTFDEAAWDKACICVLVFFAMIICITTFMPS